MKKTEVAAMDEPILLSVPDGSRISARIATIRPLAMATPAPRRPSKSKASPKQVHRNACTRESHTRPNSLGGTRTPVSALKQARPSPQIHNKL
eukprot:4978878-Pleurochrysis_carterae.AAC.1